MPHGTSPSSPDDDHPLLRRVDVDDLRDAVRALTMQVVKMVSVNERTLQAIALQTEATNRLDATLRRIHASQPEPTRPISVDLADHSGSATDPIDSGASGDDLGDLGPPTDAGGSAIERRRRATGST